MRKNTDLIINKLQTVFPYCLAFCEMKHSFCRDPELAKGWGQIVHPLVVRTPGGYVIQNWMRNRNTVRFLGLWNISITLEAIETEAGLNSFVLTPKRWVEQTTAKGIVTKQRRYAATFAHQDIAFEFASWISPEFE